MSITSGTVVNDPSDIADAQEYNDLRDDILVACPSLYNKSGGNLPAGSVVVIDSANDRAFTTTDEEDEDLVAGVLLEDIANNDLGYLVPHGGVAPVRVSGSVVRGNFLATGSSVAGYGVDIGGSMTLGTFGMALQANGSGYGTIDVRIMMGKTARFDSLYGMIVLADVSCPDQWTRFSTLDGKYPKGAAVYGGTGGASTHKHTYTDLPEHTHTETFSCGNAGSHNHGDGDLQLNSAGSHTHDAGSFFGAADSLTGSHWIRRTDASGNLTSWNANHVHSLTGTTGSVAGHQHSLSVTIDNAGVSGDLDMSTEDGEPPYLEMIFCEKTTHDEL